MSRDDLIARLEAATGPDRELDAMIDMAVSGYPEAQVAAPNCYGDTRGFWRERYGDPLREAPTYTASIDAALTMVPANALWGVKALWDQGPDAVGCPKAYRGSVDVYEERHGLIWQDNHLSLAATPALAIVIAALRAKGGE